MTWTFWLPIVSSAANLLCIYWFLKPQDCFRKPYRPNAQGFFWAKPSRGSAVQAWRYARKDGGCLGQAIQQQTGDWLVVTATSMVSYVDLRRAQMAMEAAFDDKALAELERLGSLGIPTK